MSYHQNLQNVIEDQVMTRAVSWIWTVSIEMT